MSELSDCQAALRASAARLVKLEEENAVLLEAVQRARRHAMNLGIDCGSYVEQLDAAIAKHSTETG